MKRKIISKSQPPPHMPFEPLPTLSLLIEVSIAIIFPSKRAGIETPFSVVDAYS